MRFEDTKAGQWVQPIREGYKLCCCDCGLVHRMNFRMHKKKIQFQAFRDTRSTGQVRRHMRGKRTMSIKRTPQEVVREIRTKPNVIRADVIPASANHIKDKILVIVEEMREIFPAYEYEVEWVDVHNREWYVDCWGEAWYTFWMLDYMKTEEYRKKNKKTWWEFWK